MGDCTKRLGLGFHRAFGFPGKSAVRSLGGKHCSFRTRFASKETAAPGSGNRAIVLHNTVRIRMHCAASHRHAAAEWLVAASSTGCACCIRDAKAWSEWVRMQAEGAIAAHRHGSRSCGSGAKTI